MSGNGIERDGEHKHHIQMARDNYDVINNPKVKEKYPNLYKTVLEHDKISTSSWYILDDEAYKEYLEYHEDKSIGYIK